MTGIEILNSFQVPTDYTFNWVATGIIFSIFLIVGIIGFGPFKYQDWSVLRVCLILGLIFGLLGGVTFSEVNEFETHYEVLLSDEIPLTEFLEEYEIIGQKGKIYTIRERTETDG